jgi:hypothetical protein
MVSIQISLKLNLLYMPPCKMLFFKLLKMFVYYVIPRTLFRYKRCELWVGMQINTPSVKKSFCICDEFVKAAD